MFSRFTPHLKIKKVKLLLGQIKDVHKAGDELGRCTWNKTPSSCSSDQDAPSRLTGGARRVAFLLLLNGPGHCAGFAKGRPHDRLCGLNAEYRILHCASCLCSGLVCPRSHLNR